MTITAPNLKVSIHSIRRARQRSIPKTASPSRRITTNNFRSTPDRWSSITSRRTTGQLWTRLAAELQFILVSTTKAVAATVCRQMGINANGFETWRQIHRRFPIPVGTWEYYGLGFHGCQVSWLNHSHFNPNAVFYQQAPKVM